MLCALLTYYTWSLDLFIHVPFQHRNSSVFCLFNVGGGRVGPLEKKSVLINDFLVKSQLIYFDTKNVF